MLLLQALLAGPPAAAGSIADWAVDRHEPTSAARERAGLIAELRNRPQDAAAHLAYGRLLATDYAARRTADWRDAAAAYEFALQLDPTLTPARLELGRLYMRVGRPGLAEQSFAEYVALEQGDAAAFADLSLAGLRAGDLSVALWAARRTAALSHGAAEVAAAALATGALGAPDAAGLMQRLQAVDPARAQSVALAVTAWRQAAALAAALPEADPLVRPDQAQANAPAAPANPAPWPQPAAAVSGRPMASADWRTCDPLAAAARAASAAPAAVAPLGATQSYAQTSGGSALLAPQPLPALPGPCADNPRPPMAVIEAVIVRQVDETTATRGVDLLSSLQLVARGRLRLAEEHPAGTEAQNNNFLTLSLPDNGVTYLLDILDDQTARSEVLAKPSLVALDRTPSLFFSGSTITVPVSSQFSSSLDDKVIGVSLAVTPTFISDDEMLLSVTAGRSFLENELDARLDQGIQTSANSVAANVRLHFDETLVLSGLVEREDDHNTTAIPGAGRIPLVRLFTSNKVESRTRHDVLVLLTPRRPNETGAGRGDDSLLSTRFDHRLADAVAALARRQTPEAAAVDELGRRLVRADLIDKLPLAPTPS